MHTHSLKQRILVVGMAITLAACASNPSHQQAGTIGGAVIGGVIGSALTSGSPGGAIGGAAVGGLIGHQIGRDQDRREHQYRR